ncbi:hypothetical protein ACHAPT_011271 [Fusarium lateritium]
MHWTYVLSAVAFGGLGHARQTRSNHPRFDLALKPVFTPVDNYTIEGTILLDDSFSNNSTLVQIPLIIANAPTAQYAPDDIVASDAKGELALSSHDVISGPFGLASRYWVTKRATEGTVKITFTAHTEDVDPTARVGPLFSIRNQTGGLSGSMWALVPTPNPLNGVTYDLSVTWDIPENLDAVWTWGVGPGPHNLTDTLDKLIQTFFAVGEIFAQPEDAATNTDSKFGIFWFDEPPFDIGSISDIVQTMFNYSTTFWNDTSGAPYRVIIRKNEEHGSGGTALLRSFTFGYLDANSMSEAGLKTLLSHEMTHNWPRLTGGTNAENSRYSEGMAEYYSLRLLWRSGIFSATEFVSEMNDRAYAYYTNQFVSYSDEDAMDVAWDTRDAQRIPYGRGLIHFTNLDAQMRAKYSGSLSLDKLALEFLDDCDGGGACGNTEWFGVIKSYLGQAAVNEWNQVSTGSPLLVPESGSLGPCFDIVLYGTGPENYKWVGKDGVDIESEECKI